jgi:hypothetical protein
MLNFGIDPVRYKRDIRHILAGIYRGLAQTERLLPQAALNERIKSLFKIASYKLKYEVNIRLYRKYCLAAANAYTGQHLDSYRLDYNAFKDYPRRAVLYHNKAREFETALIHEAVPTYDIEEGALISKTKAAKGAALMEKAVYEFDPVWEKELISEGYAVFANPKNKKLIKALQKPADFASELFAMNRGALRQEGIKLPVQISITGEANFDRKHLERALLKAGLKKSENARFSLNIRFNGTEGSGLSSFCELVDTAGEKETLTSSLLLRAASRSEYYNFARALGNKIFIVDTN